jgi:hypothetical protein
VSLSLSISININKLKNAKIFIANGGNADWQFIVFDHNHHQINKCKKLSKQLGFSSFSTVDNGRNTAPVFNKEGNLSHTLGKYNGSTDFKQLLNSKLNDEILLEDILPGRKESNYIICQTVELKSIYIAANGDVFPCCFTGFYPKTYGKGQYHQAANNQLIPLIKENNALFYSLEQCIEWFTGIQESWKKNSYNQGRLVICDDNCGKCQT